MRDFKLSEKFLEEYVGKQPKWGFGDLSYITYKRTYARIKEDGTQEEFWETVKRVVEGTFTIQKRHCDTFKLPWNNRKAQRSAQIMFEKIWNFKFLPPGRGLWMMGTDAIESKGSGGLNNCFNGQTEVFVLENGNVVPRRLDQLVGQDVQFPITDKDGNLEINNGTVKNFGKQDLYLVGMKPCATKVCNSATKLRFAVSVTKDHKWILANGDTTTNLSIGDKVKITPTKIDTARLDEAVENDMIRGFNHGLIFGDGTKHTYYPERQFIRLCGSKEQTHVAQLEKSSNHKSTTYPESYNGDSVVTLIDKETDYKQLPESESLEYVQGFVLGWIAADGNTLKNNDNIRLDTQNKEAAEWLIKWSGVMGWNVIGQTQENKPTNFGPRSAPLVRTILTQKECYAVVTDFENELFPEIQEDVFCPVIPDSNKFTLANCGVITHNCGMVSTSDIGIDFASPFCWTMDFLMLGVGVGFDTEGAGKILIKEPSENTGQIYKIPDTREGWIEALRLTLAAFEKGTAIPEYDFSDIRPLGAPIKTFGGTSSGPGPLRDLLDSVRALLTSRVDEYITSVDIVDIANFIGKAVVAGNVRRSAELALGRADDQDFIECKDFNLYPRELADRRWASNNSVLAEVGMNYRLPSERTSINGEPGYIWLENARAYGRMKDPINNKDYRVVGFNPCLPDYTWVMTQSGPRQIKELLDNKYTAIVNGQRYSATAFWHSGDKQIMRLELKSGRTLDLTDNHLVKMSDGTWKEAGDIKVGESVKLNKHHSISWGMSTYEEIMKGWLLGSLLGDGYINSSHNSAVLCYWGRDKYDLVDVAKDYLTKLGLKFTVTQIIERDEIRIESKDLLSLCNTFGIFDTQTKVINDVIRRQSSCFYSGFIAGYFDADGSVQPNKIKGNSLRITSVNLSNLKYIQDMLHNLGINSSIYQNRRNAGNRSLPDGNGGYKQYKCQATHELVITKSNILDFSFRIKIKSTTKGDRLHDIVAGYKRRVSEDDFTDKVINIINDMGVVPVYDCTVDDVHEFDANGIRVHNCAEQGLESYELCNLVETFPANHDSPEEYYETLKYAYMYAKTVTLIPSHDPRTNAVMIRNRRIGTSMSGIEQAKKKFGVHAFYTEFCDKGYKVLKDYDRIYSDWLGIAKSIKITTVKPSGTVSLLAGATPGVHAAHGKYYYRTMRLAHNSPLIPALLKAGYRVEYDANERTDWEKRINELDPEYRGSLIVYFAVAEHDFTKGKMDQTIWEQAENAAKMQYYWSDNSVSVTINFQKHEEKQIQTVLEHYETRLKTASFLPLADHGYNQAPYITIDEEQYNAYIKGLKKIQNLATISQNDKKIEAYCEGDKCLLPNQN